MKPIRTYTRREFLDERKEHIEAAKKQMENELGFFVIIDAGDDIVCDSCNGDVDGDLIFIYEGELTFCHDCRREQIEQIN